MNTIEVVTAMLRENTGRAMCDSGGIPKYDADGKYIGSEQGYGRGYERAANTDFAAAPYQTVEFDVYTHGDKPELGVMISVNTALWLAERYEKATGEIADLWAQCCEDERYKDESVFGLAEVFVGSYLPEHDRWPTGLYGEGSPMTINTYNHECVLDTTLQFVYFEIEGEEYVLIQTHNGCDVRGGYSTPVLFQPSGYGDHEILSFANADIICDGCGVSWFTDDAYNFYASDDSDMEDLKGYTILQVETEDELESERAKINSKIQANENQLLLLEHEDAPGRVTGPLIVHNRNAYCPHCAGKLR